MEPLIFFHWFFNEYCVMRQFSSDLPNNAHVWLCVLLLQFNIKHTPACYCLFFIHVCIMSAVLHVHTFFSLAAICRFLFTWLLAMLANFLATVLGRLMGIECLSAPSTGGTISIAVMHSSPVCFVTIFILDHLEDELVLGTIGLLVDVATGLGLVATCNKTKKEAFKVRVSC